MSPAAPLAGVIYRGSPPADTLAERALDRLAADAGLKVIRAPGLISVIAPETGAGNGRVVSVGWIRHRPVPPQPGRRLDCADVTERFASLGEDALTDLRGEFALAWIDARVEHGVLAQDQVGGRAIFLAERGDRMLFADEIVTLLRLLPATPEPDETALVMWLANDSLDDRRTLYGGVRRLGVGRRLRFDASGWDERAYWMPRESDTLVTDPDEAAARMRAALQSALRARVEDAVSVGVMLSGGFDSGAVASLISRDAELGDVNLAGYSAVFPDEPELDESDLIGEISAGLGIPTTRFSPGPTGAARLSLEYLAAWRSPTIGPGLQLELPLVRQAAADGVEVLVDGQSGDEVFGLSPFLIADLLRRGRVGQAVQLARRFPGASDRRTQWAILRSWGLKGLVGHRPHTAIRTARGLERDAPAWLRSDAGHLYVHATDQWAWKREPGPRWSAWLADVLTSRREASGLPDYIRQRGAMAGVSARPPLLDADLTTTALSLDPRLAFDSVSRPVARRAVEGLMPEAVRTSQRKSNLSSFYHRALTSEELPTIRRVLSADAGVRSWVDGDRLDAALHAPPAVGDPGWAFWVPVVWAAFTAECWLRSLQDANFAPELLEDARVPEPRPRRIEAS